MPTILIIEDNELNRDMLSRRLQRRGYDVLIAIDGQSGIDLASKSQPSLVLMDIRLPDISGWEATQVLKTNPHTQHIPIIALTAHAMEGDRDRTLAAGCDDYDTKPVEIERLDQKIKTLLERAAGNASGQAMPETGHRSGDVPG